MKISVVIVTRNRNRDCTETVESLLKQTMLPEEIIVVDSGSSAPFAYEHPKVRVIRINAEIGLSMSRNVGIRASKGDIVAFIDDDAIAYEDWIEGIFNSIKNADIVGGPVSPLYLSAPPQWMNDTTVKPFLGLATGCLQNHVIGCNMAMRREVFEKVGYFSRALGRNHGKLLSGEETEFFLRAQRCGIKIESAKIMKVSHKVLPYRLTFQYLLNRFMWQGVTDYIVSNKQKEKFGVLTRAGGGIILECVRIIVLRGRRLSLLRIAIRIGQLYGLIYSDSVTDSVALMRTMRTTD